MTTTKRFSFLMVAFLAISLLAGCGSAGQFDELRYDEPSRYYLHVPSSYDQNMRWPLFIALHDRGDDSGDCIQDWFEIADETQLFLLCPELEVGDKLDSPVNERILADILNSLYQQFSLDNRFFLVGRNEAASFALSYAYRYPQAIEGISAIEPASYPQTAGSANFPILLIVEPGDQPSLDAASAFEQSLSGSGTQTRLLEIDGIGNHIPFRVQRLTVDFFEQLSN
ncbi:MAG: hypothetical protein PVI81_03820 [Anaerolineales bacterium]|jgi:pimeloyl-ACP methyl ester carboxylesterase